MYLRYNPVNLPTLERYVEVQSQENAYDLEANIAVLKLYQFNQQYNIDITSQILLKALTNLPHTDFALCKCLLSEQMVIKSTCRVSPVEILSLMLIYFYSAKKHPSVKSYTWLIYWKAVISNNFGPVSIRCQIYTGKFKDF